jgi:uroporphyrinogen III methyltransferase / synthase
MATRLGKVYLVDAGPGDADLFTLNGKKCLEQAQVILYDQSVNDELLEHVTESAELIDVGKQAGKRCANQRAIEELLIRKRAKARTVVRLTGRQR